MRRLTWWQNWQMHLHAKQVPFGECGIEVSAPLRSALSGRPPDVQRPSHVVCAFGREVYCRGLQHHCTPVRIRQGT